MIALIDADIVLHRVGYTTENDEEWVAKARTDEMLDGILLATSATDFELYISDDRDKNFRFVISSSYKGNRKQPRPKHYDYIKSHLIREWGASIAHEMEADDALGIAQDKTGGETCICSIDKDLLQIPGQHYNFVKDEWESVTRWEGLKFFYKQILIGDISDNVKGCQGIGPVKASKIIDPIPESEGEEALCEAVLIAYFKAEKGTPPQEVLKHVDVAGKLLKIKQKEDEEPWPFLSSRPILVSELLSIAQLPEGAIPSTALTMQGITAGFQQHGHSEAATSRDVPTASTSPKQ